MLRHRARNAGVDEAFEVLFAAYAAAGLDLHRHTVGDRLDGQRVAELSRFREMLQRELLIFGNAAAGQVGVGQAGMAFRVVLRGGGAVQLEGLVDEVGAVADEGQEGLRRRVPGLGRRAQRAHRTDDIAARVGLHTLAMVVFRRGHRAGAEQQPRGRAGDGANGSRHGGPPGRGRRGEDKLRDPCQWLMRVKPVKPVKRVERVERLARNRRAERGFSR